jgi:hypothetical protein
MAISFVGLVKWSLDLFIYLLQEAFNLYYEIKHKAQDGEPDCEKNREWIHDYSKPTSPRLTH